MFLHELENVAQLEKPLAKPVPPGPNGNGGDGAGSSDGAADDGSAARSAHSMRSASPHVAADASAVFSHYAEDGPQNKADRGQAVLQRTGDERERSDDGSPRCDQGTQGRNVDCGNDRPGRSNGKEQQRTAASAVRDVGDTSKNASEPASKGAEPATGKHAEPTSKQEPNGADRDDTNRNDTNRNDTNRNDTNRNDTDRKGTARENVDGKDATRKNIDRKGAQWTGVASKTARHPWDGAGSGDRNAVGTSATGKSAVAKSADRASTEDNRADQSLSSVTRAAMKASANGAQLDRFHLTDQTDSAWSTDETVAERLPAHGEQSREDSIGTDETAVQHSVPLGQLCTDGKDTAGGRPDSRAHSVSTWGTDETAGENQHALDVSKSSPAQGNASIGEGRPSATTEPASPVRKSVRESEPEASESASARTIGRPNGSGRSFGGGHPSGPVPAAFSPSQSQRARHEICANREARSDDDSLEAATSQSLQFQNEDVELKLHASGPGRDGAPPHHGSHGVRHGGGGKKSPDAMRSDAQRKLTELQNEAAWKKTEIRKQTFEKARRVGVAAEARQSEVQQHAETHAKDKLQKVEQDKQRAKSDSDAKSSEQKISRESLRAQLQTTQIKDTIDVQMKAMTSKLDLTVKIDQQRQKLETESRSQIDNLRSQQLASKEAAIRDQVKQRQAQFQQQIEAQQQQITDQGEAEKVKIREARKAQAAQLTSTAQQSAQQLEQQGQQSAEQAKQQAQSEASAVLQTARQQAQQARAQQEQTQSGVLGTVRSWFQQDAGASILANAERVAGDIVKKGEITAKNLLAKSAQQAKQILEEAQDQAFQLETQAKQSAQQVDQRVAMSKAKQLSDMKQSIDKMNADASKQITEVKAQIESSIQQIQQRMQNGIQALEKELQVGIARIDAEEQQTLKAILQRVKETEQRLASTGEQDLTAIKKLVDSTCKSLDQQAAETHRKMEAAVQKAERKVKQQVRAHILAMAAEAEKALSMVDSLYDQACKQLEAQTAQTESLLANDAQSGMILVERTGAEGVKAVTEKGTAAQKRILDQATSASAKLDADLQKAGEQMAAMKDGTPDPEVEAVKQREVLAKEQAAALDKAMAGLGTDENAIRLALKNRTPEEIRAIKEAYKERTGRDLDADLADELSGDELTEAKANLNGDKVQAALSRIQSSRGILGTDASEVKAVLSDPSLSPGDKQKLYEEYELQTGKSLKDVISQELEPRDQQQALSALGPVTEPVKIEDKKPEELLQPGEQPPDMKMVNATAGEIRKAVNGIGTDEAAIMKALRGKSPAEIRAIMDQYKLIAGVDLRSSLRSELSGNDLMEANALLSGDPVKASVAGLRNGSEGAGTDEQKIQDVLESIKDPKIRRQVMSEFERQTGTSLRNMIHDEMTGNQRDLSEALMEGDSVKASSVRLDEAANGGFLSSFSDGIADTFGVDRKQMRQSIGQSSPLLSGYQQLADGEIGSTSLSVDREAIYAELEKIDDPDVRKEVLAGYEKRTGRSLTDSLKARSSAAENDVVNALVQGDMETAAAAKMKVASETFFGTDEKGIYKQLEGKSKKQRDAIIAAYNGKYTTDEQRRQGQDAFRTMLDSEMSGMDLEKANHLVESGEVPPEFAIKYAVDGGGTDEDGLRSVLEGKTTAEVDQIRRAYNEKYGPPNGESFDERIKGELSGRDDFEIGLMLEGEPDPRDPNYYEKRLERQKRKYNFERGKDSGLFSAISRDVMDTFSDSGADLDRQQAQLLELEKQLAHKNALTPDQQKALQAQLDESLDLQEITKKNYQATKDSIGESIATGVSVVVGAIVTAATGGAGTPLAAALVALASGGSAIFTRIVLKGSSYGFDDMAIDGAKTLLQAVTAYGGAALDKFLKSTEMNELLQQFLVNTVSSVGNNVTDALFDENATRDLGDFFKNLTTQVGKGLGNAVVDTGTGAVANKLKVKLPMETTRTQAAINNALINMSQNLLKLGIDPRTYEGNFEDIASKFGNEMWRSVVSGAAGGWGNFHGRMNAAGKKAQDTAARQGKTPAQQQAAYKRAVKSELKKYIKEQLAKREEQKQSGSRERDTASPDDQLNLNPPTLEETTDTPTITQTDESQQTQSSKSDESSTAAKTLPLDITQPETVQQEKPLLLLPPPHEETKLLPPAKEEPKRLSAPKKDLNSNGETEERKPRTIEEHKQSLADHEKATHDPKPIKEQIDNAIVDKGPEYQKAMADLREFYRQMQVEAQDIKTVQTQRIDQMIDPVSGQPRTHTDGTPYGYQINSAYDVQEFSHGLTNITIKVHLDGKTKGLTPSEIAKLREDTITGVYQRYNYQHKIKNSTGGKNRLHVEVTFVDVPDDAHLQVMGHKGEGRADQLNWYVQSDPTVHAHELGHQLGLLDEYVDSSTVHRNSDSSPGVYNDRSLMGDFWTTDAHGNVVAHPDTALKPRHLNRLGKDIHDFAKSTRTTNSTDQTAHEDQNPKLPAPLSAKQQAKLNHRKEQSRRRAIQTTQQADRPLEPTNPNKSTHGHGHSDHGWQTTEAQQSQRIRDGITPGGRTDEQVAKVTHFHSPEAEAEALGRARTKLNAALRLGSVPPFDPATGEPNRHKIVVETHRKDGFGSRVVKQRDNSGTVLKDSSNKPLTETERQQKIDPKTGTPMVDTDGQPIMEPVPMMHATFIFEYVPSSGEWHPVTYYPQP